MKTEYMLSSLDLTIPSSVAARRSYTLGNQAAGSENPRSAGEGDPSSFGGRSRDEEEADET